VCAKRQASGVNLYEDKSAFFIEASVPGVSVEDIQIVLDKGGVSIEAKSIGERKEVTYHFKSLSDYSYWIPLPVDQIDEEVVPEAICKDGILKVIFQKAKVTKPVKIAVKSA
jgi:HSP20 family molecular chaperone IbpA